jgi:Holliday junction resolvase RusA-like endonuclease
MSAVEQLYSADIVEIVLDLPFPPSTNRIWRGNGKNVYRAPKYIAWQQQADMSVMAKRQFPRRKISGPFSIHIALNDSNRGDGDNRIKAILDWCQSRDVVRNDSDCRRGEWIWVAPDQAPAGCRVTLRSLHTDQRDCTSAEKTLGRAAVTAHQGARS